MEVKLKSLKNQYLLSANELAEIAVTENNNKSKYNEIYKTIRAIERNVLEGSKGRQALFYVLGNPDKSDILLANVINLIEADSLKDIIYLNFDYRSKANVPGVWEFLSGDAKWSEVKLAVTKKRSYFYVPPGDAKRRVKFLASSRRSKMFKALANTESYEMILSRALAAGYTIENTLIQKEIDDIYIFCFLDTLEKGDIHLLNSYLDRDKVKGLFVFT